ncbi:Uncharacterised protein [Yersinia enterocolitica]|nr:Uncharacterised protein [Yersinia enterocolitica]
MRKFCCPLYLFKTRRGSTISNVIAQRIVKEHGILWHDANRLTQAVLSHITDILIVNIDSPLGDIVETKQQTGER